MAYDELRTTGLIRSMRGQGTCVSEDLWGVIPSRIPNWNQYTAKGTFLPTLPLDQRIQEAAHRPGIINLARSELSPDLFPVSAVERLLQHMSLTVPLGYADPQGAINLRESLVRHLDEYYGTREEPNQIMVTSGAQQSMHLIAQCLLGPGDSIALEGPSYAYSLSLFTSAGLRLFRIPTDDQGLRLDEVEEGIQRFAKTLSFL